MKRYDYEWRVVQVARTILYRCFGNVTIEEQTQKGLADFIVTFNNGTDLRFGVVLKTVGKLSEAVKTKWVEELQKADYNQDVNRMPIVLLVVDEQTESAKIAFLLGWRFGKPRIYKNFELRALNQKNADICLEIIKSMDEVIRLLEADNLQVLKRITFSKKLSGNRVQQAEVLYLKKLTASYRMNQKEVVDERERFERLLKGTPEEEFPQDELDEIIYEAIRKQFKNVKVRSKLILVSTDIEDLQFYKGVHCHETTLLVSPDLSGVPTVALSMLDGLEMFSVTLDVFVENIFYQHVFDGVSFDYEMPIEGWLKKVTEWNELKATMKPISVYFK